MRKYAELVLNKGGEKYVFRYEVGCEGGLMDALVDSANNKGISFDWIDAAVLSGKITGTLLNEADVLLDEERHPSSDGLGDVLDKIKDMMD